MSLGAEVHGVSSRTAAEVAAGRIEAAPEVCWHQVDLTERHQVGALTAEVRPHYVFHLAGYVKGTRDLSAVLPAFGVNLASTVYLLESAAAIGCRRFVQTGSLEEPPLDRPAEAPCSPYAASKAAATGYCRMFAELYGLPVTLARVFMVYGPGDQDWRKLVPYVALELLDGRSPSLASGVRQVDWIYVDDVVDGLLLLGLADGVVGRQVDLGTGCLSSVREVVEQLHRLIGAQAEPRFGERQDPAGERVVRADVEATERALGWRPTVELARGLELTVQWLRRHRDRLP